MKMKNKMDKQYNEAYCVKALKTDEIDSKQNINLTPLDFFALTMYLLCPKPLNR